MKTPTQTLPEVGGCSKTTRKLQHIETRHRSNKPVSLELFWCFTLVVYSTAAGEPLTNTLVKAEAKSDLRLPRRVWQDGIGSGLRKGTGQASLAFGAGVGMKVFGGSRAHDLVLGNLRYGRVLSDVVGGHSFLRGNWEGGLEWFGGGQYHPDGAYLFGFTPMLRYNFATGSRWMPFVDVGAGVSWTDIGHPDLSSKFEFNLQAGAGCHYFLKNNLALTLQYRLLHLSNARIDTPNLGVNSSLFSGGLTWFF